MRRFQTACLVTLALFLTLSTIAVFAQQSEVRSPARGSIPEALLRPARGEAPRYPVDIVIGELGRGSASVAAYTYANSITAAFISGEMEHPLLANINAEERENLLSEITAINPDSFRLGGGRIEADGTVSFLVRFIGRTEAITGELYIRYVSRQVQSGDGETPAAVNWRFDELLLEEPKERETEYQEAIHRNDFYPYERFF